MNGTAVKVAGLLVIGGITIAYLNLIKTIIKK